ncbi:hypothetical protein SESBI_31548 [Sesbania bispinosa]|nr:hypothetical protein SESBI_31548 [Sesbania bispinosa]
MLWSFHLPFRFQHPSEKTEAISVENENTHPSVAEECLALEEEAHTEEGIFSFVYSTVFFNSPHFLFRFLSSFSTFRKASRIQFLAWWSLTCRQPVAWCGAAIGSVCEIGGGGHDGDQRLWVLSSLLICVPLLFTETEVFPSQEDAYGALSAKNVVVWCCGGR